MISHGPLTVIIKTDYTNTNVDHHHNHNSSGDNVKNKQDNNNYGSAAGPLVAFN